MWRELDKIDEIRERMGVNYQEARQALIEAGGDLIQALINLEKKAETKGLKAKSEDLAASLRASWSNLNQTRINIRKGQRRILTVSAPVGIAALYTLWRNPALRLLSIAGIAGTVLSKNWELEIEQPYSSTVIDLNAGEKGEGASAEEAFVSGETTKYMI